MNFKKNYFIWLTLCAFFTVLFGAISHESGHYFAYRIMGYNPTLQIAYTTLFNDSTEKFLNEQSRIYSKEISQNKSFNGDKIYYELSDNFKADGFWPTLAGPLETMIVGTLGFLLLFLSVRNKPPNQKLNIWQWIFVFLSMFWLRPLINLVIILIIRFIRGSFAMKGDEYGIDYYLNFPSGTSNIVTFIIAIIFMSYLYLKIIPKNIKLTFLISVFTGGFLGFLFWIVWLGKIIII